MNRSTLAFVFAASVYAPFSHAAECSPPPVVSTGQAICYATAYADKNGLPHKPLNKKVTKGKDRWLVSFTDSRPDARSGGWQVDVAAASGTVTHFMAYKKPER
jgi:hypothetical protein